MLHAHVHFLAFDYTLFQKLPVQNEDAEISIGYLVYGNMTPFLDS